MCANKLKALNWNLRNLNFYLSLKIMLGFGLRGWHLLSLKSNVSVPGSVPLSDDFYVAGLFIFLIHLIWYGEAMALLSLSAGKQFPISCLAQSHTAFTSTVNFHHCHFVKTPVGKLNRNGEESKLLYLANTCSKVIPRQADIEKQLEHRSHGFWHRSFPLMWFCLVSCCLLSLCTRDTHGWHL